MIPDIGSQDSSMSTGEICLPVYAISTMLTVLFI